MSATPSRTTSLAFPEAAWDRLGPDSGAAAAAGAASGAGQSARPVLCLLHGYLLEGSGSNLWTRAVVTALIRQGDEVHLVCQEPHPEVYDLVSRVVEYPADGGAPRTTLDRPSKGAGRCTMHKPLLGDTLLVYVRDRYEEFANVVPMVESSDAQVADYLAKNVAVVEKVCAENGVSGIHANHAVLQSVVAQRVSAKLNIPFAVMPHGSAIEYACKKDPRFMDFATGAIGDADGVFVVGDELRARVQTLMGASVPDLDAKMHTLTLGVDTSLFQPILKLEDRTHSIEELGRLLESVERGRTPEQAAELLREVEALCGGAHDLTTVPDRAALEAALRKSDSQYVLKNTDAGLEEKLEGVNWSKDRLLLFVGRLIANKGLQSVLFALPEVMHALAQKKEEAEAEGGRVRLLVIGHGPQREIVEVLMWAMTSGRRKLVEAMIEWGSQLEGLGENEPWIAVQHYLKSIDAKGPGHLDAFWERCRAMPADTVIFTGYLTHRELRCLFPCVDVGLFPSVVAEAGPLVFLEAIASGAFPMGTYFAGMKASIDFIEQQVGDDDTKDVDVMKLSPEATQTIADIADKLPQALALGTKHRSVLRQVAIQRFDWASVSQRIIDFFADAAKQRAAAAAAAAASQKKE